MAPPSSQDEALSHYSASGEVPRYELQVERALGTLDATHNSKISVKFTKEDNCMLTPDTILDVHFRVHTINCDKYDLSNDLSFHPELEYTENSKLLIYYNGELVNDSAT